MHAPLSSSMWGLQNLLPTTSPRHPSAAAWAFGVQRDFGRLPPSVVWCLGTVLQQKISIGKFVRRTLHHERGLRLTGAAARWQHGSAQHGGQPLFRARRPRRSRCGEPCSPWALRYRPAGQAIPSGWASPHWGPEKGELWPQWPGVSPFSPIHLGISVRQHPFQSAGGLSPSYGF